MTPSAPKPPTRLTVSGGPKAEPRLLITPEPRVVRYFEPHAHPVKQPHNVEVIALLVAIVVVAVVVTLLLIR